MSDATNASATSNSSLNSAFDVVDLGTLGPLLASLDNLGHFSVILLNIFDLTMSILGPSSLHFSLNGMTSQ
jgi:hypothetical protein